MINSVRCLTLILIILISGCRNKHDTRGNQVMEETPERKSYSLELGCYEFVQNGDKVFMEITREYNPVKGKLLYALDGKDENIGSFIGILNENVLIANYDFISEGTESMRPVAFKIKENELIEGYGELNALGNEFVDENALNFPGNIILSRTTCSD